MIAATTDDLDTGKIMTDRHPQATGHRFAVGKMVRLSEMTRSRSAASGPYEVLAHLPEREGELQYRIKSEQEPYQRIIKENELEAV